MASLSLNNSEIVRAVLQTIGAGRTAGNMDPSTEADVRTIIREGLRRFFFPTVGEFVYQWRWREKHHPISIDALYDTGTITISAGTITLVGGSFPTWLEDGFIRVGGHVLFVTTRTSGTVLVTSNTALTIAVGTAYEAYRFRYSLPSDFAEWLGGVVYADGSDSRNLSGSSEPELRLRYAVGQGTNDQTTHFAISSTRDADELRISFWPVPQPDAFIQGVYLSIPDDNLPADLTVPGVIVQVAPMYAKAVVEAILAEAENYLGKTGGEHETRFNQALQIAIAHDKSLGGAYDFSRQIQPDYRGMGPPPTEINFDSQL
jgi:hypothetical protein